jgi:hypothetical protein
MIDMISPELAKGIKVEQEHKPTFEFIKSFVTKHGRMPSAHSVYKHIALDHLRGEDSHYYSNHPDI